MSFVVTIAARGGAAAKTRCSDVLGPNERARLAEAMLADMLCALASVRGLARIRVITPTPSLVRLAEGVGADAVTQSLELQAADGLNAAFELGMDLASERDPYAGHLLLPGDLPRLKPADVDALLSLCSEHAVVVARALLDGGTGALALRAGARIRAAFGPDSFARHLAHARAAGLPSATVSAESLGLDVDRPEDLAALIEGAPTTLTAGLLRRTFDRAARLR